jgi:tetratricopeptide (TPR) repeat protein
MRAREKIEAVHIILLAAGIVLLAGFLFLAVRFARAGKHSSDFSYSLENIDAHIGTEDYAQASQIIEGLQSFPDYRADWLRLLKRCRLLALRTGRHELFSGMAARAHEALPDDEELSAIAAIALIDSGKVQEAAPLGDKLSALEFRSVAAEIHVRGGTLPKGEAQGELVYAVLPESKNPLDFIMAGDLSGEPGFFVNAALALLETQRRQEALDILYAPRTAQAYPYLTALVSYDAGSYEKALSYWELLPREEKMRPRALQLRADSFLRQENYEESQNVHEIFLYNYPEYSPIPYLAINFLRHRKAPFSGMPSLQKGLAFFPRDLRLLIDYAKNLVAGDKKAEGVEIADKVFSDFSDPGAHSTPAERHAAADSRVLRLVAQMGDVPLGRITSELWILRGEYPEDPSAAALLRWQLFSLNDFSAIRQLLAGSPDDAHAFSYLAALDFAEGSLLSAREKLEEGALRFPACPEVFYNLGLVHLKMRDPGEALAAFLQASGRMRASQTPGLQERTDLRIFDSYVLLGRFSEAARTLKEFLEKNPAHPEALQKLRKLEARGE